MMQQWKWRSAYLGYRFAASNMLIQRRTEAMNEGHRPDARRGAAIRAVLAQATFHHAQEYLQHGALQGRVRLQKVSQPLRHGEHPLTNRQTRKDVIDQMRRCFGHAPGVTRGTNATTLARVRDQEIVLALITVRSGEAMRENSAFQILAKGALDMGRW